MSDIRPISSQPGQSLGRHIHHDPRSRRFPYIRGAALSVPTVMHPRNIPIFDQGDMGRCTAEASLGILGHTPYWESLCQAVGTSHPTGAGPYSFDVEGRVALYHDITGNDPFDGQWPPDDTGSDGLSAAKTLQAAGIIPGYQHTFSAADALAALKDFPLLVGTNWSESMFYPNPQGLVRYDPRGVVGGHEWIVDQATGDTGMVGGTTSWGTSFGKNGRFYLSVLDFARLLADDGDVIVLSPPTAAPPVPAPDADDADRALAAAFHQWARAKGL